MADRVSQSVSKGLADLVLNDDDFLDQPTFQKAAREGAGLVEVAKEADQETAGDRRRLQPRREEGPRPPLRGARQRRQAEQEVLLTRLSLSLSLSSLHTPRHTQLRLRITR